MKTVKIGDLVQFSRPDGSIYFGNDQRIGIVMSDEFVNGYGVDVVKVWTTHFLGGEEIYATWPIMHFEVLA